MTKVIRKGSNGQANGCTDFDRMSRKGTRMLLEAELGFWVRHGNPNQVEWAGAKLARMRKGWE